MQLPDNWQDTKPIHQGEFVFPTPGAYICKICSVKFTTSRSGRNMLVLDLDIADGSFKDFFTNKAADAADAGRDIFWGLSLYQLTDGSSFGFFMGLLHDINDSNDGFRFQDHVKKGVFDEKSLKGKLLGALLVGEEYEYDGKVRMSLRVGKTYSVEKVRAGKTQAPWIKGLDGSKRKLDDPPPDNHHALEHVDDIDIPF